MVYYMQHRKQQITYSGIFTPMDSIFQRSCQFSLVLVGPTPNRVLTGGPAASSGVLIMKKVNFKIQDCYIPRSSPVFHFDHGHRASVWLTNHVFYVCLLRGRSLDFVDKATMASRIAHTLAPSFKVCSSSRNLQN